jgi:hypothetical protein
MHVDEYWKQFEKISQNYHYFIGSIYFFIGILSLVMNSMVLHYLIKYIY